MTEQTHNHSITNPYARDVFLSYLVEGAERTVPDGYPIIKREMVASEVPKDVFQWDCRHEVTNPYETGMSFYCQDPNFAPILNHPYRYLDKLSKYACVIGMDASPYDNMPLVVQKSQIFTNLAITYFFGKQGLQIVPNVRLGNNDTIGMLDAVPRECLIAIGTNGFMKKKANRAIFQEQMSIVTDTLHPSGIIVYGPAYNDVFQTAIDAGISIHQFDSHTMKRNAKVKADRQLAGDCRER